MPPRKRPPAKKKKSDNTTTTTAAANNSPAAPLSVLAAAAAAASPAQVSSPIPMIWTSQSSPAVHSPQLEPIASTSSGTLKATISLGKNPIMTIITPSGPFYLIKDLPHASEITGETDFMSHFCLEKFFKKLVKKTTENPSLSSYLPHLPGEIDSLASIDGSGLRMLVENPPILGHRILPLTDAQLLGFRLHPGPLPIADTERKAKAKKFKKHLKKKDRDMNMNSSRKMLKMKDKRRKSKKLAKKKKKEAEQSN